MMTAARNRRMGQAILTTLAMAVLCAAAHGKIIYVDGGADGAGDGANWSHAYRYLQDGLTDALNSAERPIEIRVAQGVYRPDQGKDQKRGDTNTTFRLLNGVSLRGGFAGVGEPDPDARDIDAYETILSGDLANNDGPDFANYEDNAQVVVTSVSSDPTAILEGFTITGGFGWSGAGLNSYDSSPTIDSCTFAANMAGSVDGGYGGAAAFSGGSPTLSRCTFTGNYAMNQGGAIANQKGANLTLRECSLIANYADNGGAVHSAASDVNAVDCTFAGNQAETSGGAFYCHQGKHVLTGCTFTSNAARYGGGLYNLFGAMDITRCIFTANDADEGGGVYVDSSTSVTLTHCLLTGNRARDFGGAALAWCDSSPKLTNCTIGDNRAPLGSAIAGGLPVLWNCIVWNQEPTKLPFQVLGDGPAAGYSCIQGGWPGPGNLDTDPLFAAPGHWDVSGTPDDPNDDFFVAGDYHLQSQFGRWDPNSNSFVVDQSQSRCIDAGDPNSDVADEPFPNGDVINMGAYGGTAEASKSAGGDVACGTGTYEFLPELSTILQTGGFAGVHWTYRLEGRFQLTVDCETGTASFSHVDANAIDDSSAYLRSLDPNEEFNMADLVGSVGADGTISFSGKAPNESQVIMTLTFKGDSVHLVGETIPPPGSADFFLLSMDAVAQLADNGKEPLSVK